MLERDVLEKVGLGFFCSTADGKISTNHRLALKNLNLKNLIRVVKKNAEDLVRLLEISKSLGLRIFRLGSNFVPFASHPSFEKSWYDEVKRVLRDLVPTVKRYGVRITMHPGQFVVLNSPKKEVVESSLKELWYHFWLLDELEQDEDGVVVVHVGGVYGDKDSSIKRFLHTVKENRWLLRRLAVENDEKHYTVEEVLSIASVGLPVVFDHYHHTLNPSRFFPRDVLETWGKRTPEFHVSSAPDKAGRLGEHGDWVKLEDFVSLVGMFKGHRFDVIVEAKKKEKAVEELISELRKFLEGSAPEVSNWNWL